jgi:hypothetical protein
MRKPHLREKQQILSESLNLVPTRRRLGACPRHKNVLLDR